MFVIIYVLSIYLIVPYGRSCYPANTVFLALSCFFGIVDLSDGTAASALLSGGG
jgi:hypothetical protein